MRNAASLIPVLLYKCFSYVGTNNTADTTGKSAVCGG